VEWIPRQHTESSQSTNCINYIFVYNPTRTAPPPHCLCIYSQRRFRVHLFLASIKSKLSLVASSTLGFETDSHGHRALALLCSFSSCHCSRVLKSDSAVLILTTMRYNHMERGIERLSNSKTYSTIVANLSQDTYVSYPKSGSTKRQRLRLSVSVRSRQVIGELKDARMIE
jgi:hypothetical protein